MNRRPIKRTSSNPRKESEHDIQSAILEYLAYKHVFHYRNNSGAMKSEYKGKTRFMRFGVVGAPDIVCVINGRYVGLEVKRPGGKPTEAQLDFGERLRLAGGIYYIVQSLEDAIGCIACELSPLTKAAYTN